MPNSLLAKQPEPDSFKDYISFKLGSNLLFLDPELSRTAKKTDDMISFKFGKSIMTVSFNPGPSEDPAFDIKYNKIYETLDGQKLYISSSGSLYIVNDMNLCFERRLKYIISNDKLTEIKQPYYLVNKECEASTTLQMFEMKCNQGKLIAQLPKGSTLRILLMEDIRDSCPSIVIEGKESTDQVNNYLVTTPFGLVGWVSSSCGYYDRPGIPLGCLRLTGD